MRTITLKALGTQLPIGTTKPDGTLDKSFKLRPFLLEQEKQLAALRERHGDRPLTMGRFVSHVLALMTEEVAGIKVQTLPEAERVLVFSTMAMADVLYMYLYLRLEAMGNEVKFKVGCPRCKAMFPATADLESMDVRVADDAKGLLAPFALRHGLEHLGQVRKSGHTRPLPWSVFESQDVANEGALKAAVLQGCIAGLEGIDPGTFAPLPGNVLDKMAKRDVETLTSHISEVAPGPQMAVEAECTHCRSKGVWPINWSYDSFFSASSL